MNDKIELLNLSLEELEGFVKANGFQKFRAKQLMSWLIKGAPFDEMRNLPKDLISFLKENCVSLSAEIIKNLVSKQDGTQKLLYALKDGNVIEGALMRYSYGCTLCISTQAGCAMGCRFCASTVKGKKKDLSAAEMLSQIICANNVLKDDKVRNIVLMGSGEPLDNYINVLRFIHLAAENLNISPRRITLSTCGIVPKIYDLAKENLPITLSVSLHAPNDTLRKRIMPIANAFSLDKLIESCRHYVKTTGRRVSFEYALIKGFNDRKEHAEELANLLRGFQCHVNLIPLNDVKESVFKASSRKSVQLFYETLLKEHTAASIRRTMGQDINGACGQLRSDYLKGEEL
ncbi:MAG: 23S rRNA (adenine(2503)-C(2))-methyltransferase RlmN [Christensenellales bacterium]|jgi:23S rRNA (adenine2503-C2)-methyltransferase